MVLFLCLRKHVGETKRKIRMSWNYMAWHSLFNGFLDVQDLSFIVVKDRQKISK